MAVNKVLHVIPSVGPLRGGPSAMVRSLGSALARTGIEAHVATTDDNGPERLQVRYGVPVVQDGVTYWYFPRQTRFYGFSWPLNAWLARHVADYDVLHIHALFSFAGVPAALWARRNGVPYVVRPLGTLNHWGMTNRRRWLKALSFRCIESGILRHAARVHYTSEQERIEAESLGVRTPAAVIPNALREQQADRHSGTFIARHAQLRGRQIVLFLSRLDPVKGVDLLLEAFARIRGEVPNASLVIAGSGDRAFVENLRLQAVSLGLGSDVVWPGFLTGGAKRAALADADVFVLPSYSESFGIAVAEAMQAGVAVVVSDRVGIHRQIAAADAGIVVPCDVPHLADALVRLLKDSALRTCLGANARTLTSEHYSSEAVTRKLIALYNEIAPGIRPSPCPAPSLS